MKKKVFANTRYVETDPRNLLSEEDLLEDIEGNLLNLCEDYGLTLDEAAESCMDYFKALIGQAKSYIRNGHVKSVYDRL